MDIVGFLSNLPELIGLHLAVIFGLITFDVLAGIGRAIRWRVFNWVRVAEFYRSNVLPFMLGYLGYSGFVFFVTPYIGNLPPEVELLISDALAWVGFGAVCIHIVASIKLNIQGLIEGMPEAKAYDDTAKDPESGQGAAEDPAF